MALSTTVGIEFIARNRAQAGMAGFQRQLGSIQATTIGLGRTLMSVFGVAGGAYLIGQAFRGGIREAAAFEQQMANVSTLLNDQSSRFLPQYTEQIREMSRQFGESAETLSKGLYDIISASIPAEHALNVLTVATKAAKAGITDTAVSADAITTILNSYNLSADRAADVSDRLFATVVRGKTTFAELAPNIGKVAAVAATTGVSFEDLSANMATMTRAGVQTEIAITSLRAILLSFLKPQQDSIEAARKYGVELNSNTLRTIGLTGVIERLKRATAEELAIIVPTSRAITGFAAAIQKAAGLAEDYDYILNSTGETEKAYQKIAENSAFKLEQLNQRWTDFKRIIGDISINPLISAFSYINKTLENTVELAREAARYLRSIGLSMGAMEPLATIPFNGPSTGQGGGPVSDQVAAFRRQQALEMMTMLQLQGLGGYSNEIKAPPGPTNTEIVLGKEQIAADKRMAQLRQQVAEEIELTGRLNEPRQHAKMMIDFQAEAAARYGENTQQAIEATEQFRQSLRQLEQAESLARIADSIGQAFSTAFEDAILNAQNLQDVLRALGNSIQRAFFQEMVSKPLAQMFANFASNMMASGTSATVAHGGGRVGSIGARRYVDSSVFDNAPRFHDLRPGETAIIAQNDEVISRPGGRMDSGSEGLAITNNFNMQMIDGKGARAFFDEYSAQVSYAQSKEERNNRGRRNKR